MNRISSLETTTTWSRHWAHTGHAGDLGSYYDRGQLLFDIFWSRYSLHNGVFLPGTRSFSEALENTNRLVHSALRVEPGGVVLDAGCGVGASSIFMAHQGLLAIGMTLSPVQARRARADAERCGVAGKTMFVVSDYMTMPIADGTLDGAFAIESASSAPSQAQLFERIAQALRPGARVVLVDGFLRREPTGNAEEQAVLGLADGFHMPILQLRTDICSALAKAGFRNIEFTDLSEFVRQSVNVARLYGLLLDIPLRLASRLGVVPTGFSDHALACRSMATVLSTCGEYGILSAECGTKQSR